MSSSVTSLSLFFYNKIYYVGIIFRDCLFTPNSTITLLYISRKLASNCRFAVSDQRKIGLDVEIWSIIRFTVTSLILFVGNKGFYFRFLTTELDLNRRRQFKCISNCSGASTHTCIHSYIRVCVLYVSSLSPLTMLTLSPADKHPEEEEKKKKRSITSQKAHSLTLINCT